MQRRNFIQLGTVGVGAGLLLPELTFAKNKQSKLAGGVFYTKQNPGRWSKKVAGHLPNIKIEDVKGNISIKVTTAHEMKGYEHYIVKHVILDQNYNFLDEKLFDPMKDKIPVSTFSLGKYKGYIHVLSMCNKHDVWLKGIKI